MTFSGTGPDEGRAGMKIAVRFQDERLDFEVPDDRLVGHWSGPEASADGVDAREMARRAIEAPIDFPPLLRSVVPGDRVVLPLDASTPDLPAILEVVAGTLRAAGVDTITAVSTDPEPPSLPGGVSWRVHDPDDRAGIAYLSSTKEGQRVYLNRYLTDTDIVIPIGALGYDGTLGYRGPWSVIYPGLSDRETLTRYRGLATEASPDREAPASPLLESAEVGWLLGCQLQIGVLGGIQGASKVMAGLESTLRAEGARAVDESWTFRADERADVVVAGIGAPGRSTSVDDLAEGLATAARLVRRGGKVVALSRAEGEVGPAVRRLAGAENPRSALNRLKGREADPDYGAARRIASALAWADIYLHGALDTDLVEELGMIPIDRPGEARKLAGSAASCIILSQADRTRAIVPAED